MSKNVSNRIYIIGAGLAGISIAKEIQNKKILGIVVAFIDDNPSLIGKKLVKIPVLGPIESVVELLKIKPDDEAIIAIPSGTDKEIRRIYNILKRAEFARIRILPGISQILEGDAHLVQTREINPEDFLSRTPVKVSLKESLSYVRGKRVLVTGAGGSIGNELSRQLLFGGAERLFLLGHGENSIYEIDRELRILQEERIGEKATIVPVIGELQDRDYMFHILKRLKANVIFHVAAYKHVPLMEENPVAAIQNNVFGTKNLLDASLASNVNRFVMISTDKAVEPSSIYGVSKYIAEQLVIHRHEQNPDYLVVRFGNVLGSRGSILPVFKQQILKGGPITITDPEASRFFMTIPEAVSLVLKAGGIKSNGSLYILDMGEPVKITELAKQMIEFYGFEPEKDIKIRFTELRPGEKLNEKLWFDTEKPEPTGFPKILKIVQNHDPNSSLDNIVKRLEPVCFFDKTNPGVYRNRIELKKILKEMTPNMEFKDDEPEY
jgi:FlaA1/EpsC-like NDP-sugar epimerase